MTRIANYNLVGNKNDLSFKASINIKELAKQAENLEIAAASLRKEAEKMQPEIGEGARKIYKFIGEKLFSPILNSKLFEENWMPKLFNARVKKMDQGRQVFENGVPVFEKDLTDTNLFKYIIHWGNVGKEIIGTLTYTYQAYNNKDLPPDKRVFVAAYDFGVGIVSTTMQAIIGLIVIAKQGKWLNKLADGLGFNKEKLAAKGLTKEVIEKMMTRRTKFLKGLEFVIPVAITTIFVKRILAPAIATPVAGGIKAKLLGEDKSLKAQPTSQPAVQPTNQFVSQPTQNVFDRFNAITMQQKQA